MADDKKTNDDSKQDDGQQQPTVALNLPTQQVGQVNVPKNIPVAQTTDAKGNVTRITQTAHTSCLPPPADEAFSGSYKRDSDGLVYALAVHEPDTYGRTHTAKNSAFFWQGTKEEFRQQFEKA